MSSIRFFQTELEQISMSHSYVLYFSLLQDLSWAVQ